MSEANWDASVVRAYLLARLPDLERSQLDHRLGNDRDYALFFASVEDELVMDYVSGRLGEEDRQRFEAHYQGSEEHAAKIRFARALAKSLQRERQRKRQRLVWASLLLAAFIPVAIWFIQARTLTADLYPGIYRGAGQAPTVQIGRVAATVRLRLHCDRSFSNARATLRRSGSPEDVLIGTLDVPSGLGIWNVPAQAISPGEYVIQIGANTEQPETFLLLVRK